MHSFRGKWLETGMASITNTTEMYLWKSLLPMPETLSTVGLEMMSPAGKHHWITQQESR